MPQIASRAGLLIFWLPPIADSHGALEMCSNARMALDQEWPNFDGVPDDDSLTAARPRGQKLARYLWWNGDIRESDSLSVHYYANALHYGTAVFEGIRCYPTANGAVLVRLREHIE